MSKLYSSDHIEKVLMKNGFQFASQKGSHKKFRKNIGAQTLTVIVPSPKKEIPQGTFQSVLRQSKLNRKDFD